MSTYDQNILVTGGTGSVGKALVKHLLEDDSVRPPRRITVLSRDEAKQHNMKIKNQHDNLKFAICDVRDYASLEKHVQKADIVVHAAALKHVPVCEEFPIEAIKTNVTGAQNLMRAVANSEVSAVVGVSTDKACYPTTTMGTCKALQEKIILNNTPHYVYFGDRYQRSMVVRYGNLLTSRGSVIELFRHQEETGNPITLTHKSSTRFVMKLQDAVDIILYAINRGEHGDIIVPDAVSVDMIHVANAIAYKSEIKEIGLRPGEKLHEYLLTDEECKQAHKDQKWIRSNKKYCNTITLGSSEHYNKLSSIETEKFLVEEGIL